MSLSKCLSKAGDALSRADKTAILSLAKELRESGTSNGEAGRQAVARILADTHAAIAKIKDALGLSPKFSRKDEPFYSALVRNVEGINAKAQGTEGWRAQIKGLVNKGLVKADEVEWSGLDDWLKAQPGKVTKDQVLDFLAKNGVQVHEVTKGDAPTPREVGDGYRAAMERQGASVNEAYKMWDAMLAWASDLPADEALKDRGFDMLMRDGKFTGNEIHEALSGKGDTKYGQYTLPGGKNYREVLLTLPESFGAKPNADGYVPLSAMTDAQYRSSHWEEPNVIAHIRLNDRTDVDGKRVLLVEELQSDHAQQGRKQGFRDPEKAASLRAQADALKGKLDVTTAEGRSAFAERQRLLSEADDVEGASTIPRAPFVDSTDKWLPLALKRIVKLAADEGYDRVAFVNGKQAAERFSLDKQLSSVEYQDNHTLGLGKADLNGPPSRGILHAYDHRNERAIDRPIDNPEKELPDLIGKELADRLLSAPAASERTGGGNESRVRRLKGEGLKVEAAGMRGFYDSIVPTTLKKLLPKLGGDGLRDTTIPVDSEGWHITPPDQTASGKWMVKSSDYNSKGMHFGTEAEARAALAEKIKTSQQPGFDITPAMREKAQGGLPLFSRKEATIPGLPEKAPSSLWERSKSVVSDLIDEGLSRSGVYRLTAPMSEGTARAKAVAQNYINGERVARDEWNSVQRYIEKNFDQAQREKMWNAADQENEIRSGRAERTPGAGLDGLEPKERAAVEQLHAYGEELLQRAKDVGMFTGEGVPYWTPRMMVMLDENGEYARPPSGEPGKKQTAGGEGRNVSTSSSNLKQRKYLTAAESEAAMKAKGGEMVRDVLTMPMAMYRLERAIAGRELVNQIKDLGRATGEPTVVTGKPQHDGWFTLDHGSFTTWAPRFGKDEATGKMKALLDEHGEMVFDRVPLYMSKEFEGPVKAILTQPDGALYRAFMLLKSKSMSAIMFSPLIHNMVIFGRALGYDPTFAGTAALYVKGYGARKDRELVREAIGAGMVPMGYGKNGMLDITDVARGFGREGGPLDPNESLVSHGAGALVGIINKNLGAKVKGGIDAAGNFWHGTLLWDRIADLQMGIYQHARERMVGKGMSEETASIMAAHWANRYAGAVGRENMSTIARKTANVMLFSRSFNMGNIGTIKDLFYGLPEGLRGKLVHEQPGEAAAALSMARRKAWGAFIADSALALIGLAAAQSAVDRLKKDKGWDEIFGGYTDRARRMWEEVKAHPATPDSYNPLRLSPTHDNEPGKEDRVDFGEIPDQGARHQYMRLPTGKVVEDLFHWMFHPAATFSSKMSPLAKAVWQVVQNDKGYDVPVFDPAGSAGKAGLEIAAHIAKAQLPWDTIVTMWDKAHGKTTAIENDKLVGQMTGFTWSQGHPGGPESGVAAQVEERVKQQRLYAMEEVKRLLRYDDEDKARARLEEIGLSQKEINSIIQRLEKPKAGMGREQRKKFNQHSSDDDRTRMEQVTR